MDLRRRALADQDAPAGAAPDGPRPLLRPRQQPAALGPARPQRPSGHRSSLVDLVEVPVRDVALHTLLLASHVGGTGGHPLPREADPRGGTAAAGRIRQRQDLLDGHGVDDPCTSNCVPGTAGDTPERSSATRWAHWRRRKSSAVDPRRSRRGTTRNGRDRRRAGRNGEDRQPRDRRQPPQARRLRARPGPRRLTPQLLLRRDEQLGQAIRPPVPRELTRRHRRRAPQNVDVSELAPRPARTSASAACCRTPAGRRSAAADAPPRCVPAHPVPRGDACEQPRRPVEADLRWLLRRRERTGGIGLDRGQHRAQRGVPGRPNDSPLGGPAARR